MVELVKKMLECGEKISFAKYNSMEMVINPKDIVFQSESSFPELELKAFQEASQQDK